ncbi:hypothetical protein [Allopontixanthobacter sp.]|uniref:hypothetical protein n=1 Tax=Allopontixanthobacter sp. TaxID=2906452 RepID=UPI002AB88F81|nr:hypothetical protein [Allopontixanthobacter sp.]MDZ4307365.1 hypothetical protein [Allopontixanthobacter sp.]
MSAPALITQADQERLFAAVRKAGLQPQRVKLTRDGLEIFFQPNGGLSASYSASDVELD